MFFGGQKLFLECEEIFEVFVDFQGFLDFLLIAIERNYSEKVFRERHTRQLDLLLRELLENCHRKVEQLDREKRMRRKRLFSPRGRQRKTFK